MDAEYVSTMPKAAQPEEKPRAIPTLLDHLTQKAASVDMALNGLIDRLVPILGPERDNNSVSEADDPDRSPIGYQISNIIGRLDRIERVIESITGRVEV